NVQAAGLNPSVGYARAVTFDAAARLTDDYDSAGKHTHQEWKTSTSDLVVAKTDPAGLKTTTIYDYAERPKETYGPAPTACVDGDLHVQHLRRRRRAHVDRRHQGRRLVAAGGGLANRDVHQRRRRQPPSHQDRLLRRDRGCPAPDVLDAAEPGAGGGPRSEPVAS